MKILSKAMVRPTALFSISQLEGGTMKILSKPMERRRHKRLAVIGSPIAIMSLGPSVPGKVTRISPESVEIVYEQVNGTTPPAETGQLDIIAADFARPICLEGLPVKLISEGTVNGNSSASPRKRVLAFDGMTADQRNQLQSFIYSFAY
jgi:hypothetical protein